MTAFVKFTNEIVDVFSENIIRQPIRQKSRSWMELSAIAAQTKAQTNRIAEKESKKIININNIKSSSNLTPNSFNLKLFVENVAVAMEWFWSVAIII